MLCAEVGHVCGDESIRASVPNEAYVWQRGWTPSVSAAIVRSTPHLAGFVVLGAEVSFQQNHPKVARSEINYSTLRDTKLPVGIALRVGPCNGPFGSDAQPTSILTGLAAALVTEAKAANVPLKELQLDFDCAESKLDGYRVWVEAIRRRIAPVPLTITALPCWLGRSEFASLAAASDGYVLQVHSLERPAGPATPMTLCDPSNAMRVVQRAESFGIPFRVALPTYGYVAGFDQTGKLLGLSAEGPLLTWPASTKLREVRAQPTEMARLVQTWTKEHPAHLRGILWYRLPTDGDRLNWSWPTLASVMKGKIPHPRVRSEIRRPERRLHEIVLINDGDADMFGCEAVLDCGDNRVMAADAQNGFELIHESATRVRLQTTPASQRRLAPGERLVIGWLRTEKDKEIKVYVASSQE